MIVDEVTDAVTSTSHTGSFLFDGLYLGEREREMPSDFKKPVWHCPEGSS
jgi:hypothetical protein